MMGRRSSIAMAAAVLGLVAGSAGLAGAQTTYSLSGKFGAQKQSYFAQTGGSFVGSFSATGLNGINSRGTLESFDVKLLDASGKVVYDISSTDATTRNLIDANYYGKRHDAISLSEGPNGLTLDFKLPFNNLNQYIPTDSHGVSSLLITNMHGMVPGSSGVHPFAAVPEPSSVIMTATAGLVGLGAWRLRRRRAIAA